MKRDLLLITDFTRKEITELFNLAMELKTKTISVLEGKILAMLFQKPSTRTRVSFEVAMTQLGGHAVYLSPDEVGLGQREAVSDVARVLSRYTNGIMARVFEHEIVQELARYASVPVINGLSALSHPCQVLGDMLTVIEHKGIRESYRIAYVGDGNNVANSWINLAARYPISLRLGVPEGYEPSFDLVKSARAEQLSDIDIFHDPREAVKNADVVYTDVWTSMGQESEAEKRRSIFRDFCVDADLLQHADNDCIVMHCLPAHRGEEITDEVIDGPHSVVFDEAENRLHIQKAILVKLLQKERG